MINFIGIGAQKSGTSWAYACLYEHPEICAPIKEIHFFSRPRFEKGKEWYESHFSACSQGKLQGEFSTSYLYSQEAAERIHGYYPDTKIIAILRNPVDRAYSQYRNAIKAGEIPESVSFDAYQKSEPSVIEQGKYAAQLERYVKYFKKEHMLVLIYEDIEKDPGEFMKRIYAFLGVDTSFVPTMLNTQINVARTPKHIFVDRVMHHSAEFLRKVGLDRFVWAVRKLGVPDLVRLLNTKQKKSDIRPSYDRDALALHFKEDARLLTPYCGRDMVKEWNLL
jgi:hypothetical protein